MKKRLFYLCCILATATACSTSLNLSGEKLTSESLIWQITGGELSGKSYLVGTLPIQDSAFFQYPEKIWSYLEDTDVFISFDTETTEKTQALREKAFSDYGRHYSILPSAYFQQIAEQQMKPVISLNEEYSLQNIEVTLNESPSVDKQDFIDDFFMGNSSNLVDYRTKMDLSVEQLNQLRNRNNYLILDELVRHMKLQPVFFPVDVAYLTGPNGLINLLRARGYQVQQKQIRHYAQNAKSIQERRALFAVNSPKNIPGQPTVSSGNSTPVGQVYGNYEIPEDPIPLNLPLGMINIIDWPRYSLPDSLASYVSPSRLKPASERQKMYSTIDNNMEYTIEIKPNGKNFKKAIQQIIISNGGQLVNNKMLTINQIPAQYVELIYTESQLSKHVLIPIGNKMIVASVKGNTPAIFSLQADQFLTSIQPNKNLTKAANNTSAQNQVGAKQQPPETIVPIWKPWKLKEATVYFPKEPDILEADLEDKSTIQGRVIKRGEVDNNLYLFTATEKSSINNFKLFNESINETAELARAVIVERNVMPQGKTNFSSYLLRDSLENYYRIAYWYQNGVFYQLIIRGNEDSVENDTANQIFNSVNFGFKQMPNAVN